MTDSLDIIAYIRDDMLTDPTINAGLVWEIARVAEFDDEVYRLMNEWMKESDPHFKRYTFNRIVESVTDHELYNE